MTGQPPVPPQAAVLEGWSAFLKRGLIRKWPQERAEICYLAFCAGFVTGEAAGAAAERERWRDLIIRNKPYVVRFGGGLQSDGIPFASLRVVADLLDGTAGEPGGDT